MLSVFICDQVDHGHVASNFVGGGAMYDLHEQGGEERAEHVTISDTSLDGWCR